MATVTDLRQQPEKELLAKAAEIRERLFNLAFKAGTDTGSNSAEVTELRRDVARIQGILTERKQKGAPKKDNRPRAQRTLSKARAAYMKDLAAKKAALKAAPSKKAKPANKPKAAKGARAQKAAVAEKKA